MDVGYERRLANHLGAHRTPSILGVINGKVTFFHYAVAKEHLRQFVEDLLPQRLVERVNICPSCHKYCICSILQDGGHCCIYGPYRGMDCLKMNEMVFIFQILGHWQERRAVLEQLAWAQQTTCAPVWPSACCSSTLQSRLLFLCEISLRWLWLSNCITKTIICLCVSIADSFCL